MGTVVNNTISPETLSFIRIGYPEIALLQKNVENQRSANDILFRKWRKFFERDIGNVSYSGKRKMYCGALQLLFGSRC